MDFGDILSEEVSMAIEEAHDSVLLWEPDMECSIVSFPAIQECGQEAFTSEEWKEDLFLPIVLLR